MKKLLALTVCIAFFASCNSDKNSAPVAAGVHKAVVQEVLQTSQYTYLHVKEEAGEKWLAVSKMQAANGETYYYKDGLPMNKFESKELNRTFDEVIFLDNISTSPDLVKTNTTAAVAAVTENTIGAGQAEEISPEPAAQRSAVAEEVLQTSKYTYMRVKEDNADKWLAVSKMEASAGKTYYYHGGLLMTDFASKELKRTFKEIYFVDNISASMTGGETADATVDHSNEVVSKGSAIDLEKKQINISHSKDDITIAKLIENRKSYSGKTIKVKGQVTKYTAGIMKKNWIHIQDGTESSGKFDLTVTTDQEVKIGDKITAEGAITIDKDFGYGYYYDVLMEDAKISK